MGICTANDWITTPIGQLLPQGSAWCAYSPSLMCTQLTSPRTASTLDSVTAVSSATGARGQPTVRFALDLCQISTDVFAQASASLTAGNRPRPLPPHPLPLPLLLLLPTAALLAPSPSQPSAVSPSSALSSSPSRPRSNKGAGTLLDIC